MRKIRRGLAQLSAGLDGLGPTGVSYRQGKNRANEVCAPRMAGMQTNMLMLHRNMRYGVRLADGHCVRLVRPKG